MKYCEVHYYSEACSMGRQSRSDVQSQKQQCSQTQADEIGQHISDLFTYKGKTKLMKYWSDEQ